ncbi:MAG: DUF4337 domain-containing protein [Acidobacteriaceae bacterium]|nr:DUF4337 domain-containing protein [Acidobacteriaceae bacterium]MBV9498555.1 DUF4337 domain-containing protein [Acidobacteriaceae bacterium]
MSASEELEEHVHHAREPFDKAVAATMAIIAALLAVVSVLRTHYNTEMLMNQQLASDQWAYFQAKDIRRYLAQEAQDTLSELRAAPSAIQKYTQDANRYKAQGAEIQKKANEFENERNVARQKVQWFHFGELFLEIAIVFLSLAILTKRKPIYVAGVVLAVVGIGLSAAGYWA